MKPPLSSARANEEACHGREVRQEKPVSSRGPPEDDISNLEIADNFAAARFADFRDRTIKHDRNRIEGVIVKRAIIIISHNHVQVDIPDAVLAKHTPAKEIRIFNPSDDLRRRVFDHIDFDMRLEPSRQSTGQKISDDHKRLRSKKDWPRHEPCQQSAGVRRTGTVRMLTFL